MKLVYKEKEKQLSWQHNFELSFWSLSCLLVFVFVLLMVMVMVMIMVAVEKCTV